MRIFLSHPSRLKPLIRDIKKVFPSFLETWLDEEQLCWGDDLEKSIERAIKSEVDYLIIFLDTSAFDSKWVVKELKWAFEEEERQKRIFVLPILTDNKPIEKMPEFIKRKVQLRLQSYDDRSVRQMGSEIAEKLFQLIVNSQSKHVQSSNIKYLIQHSNEPDDTIDGIYKFVRERDDLGQEWWDSFFDINRRPKKVILMGQSLSRSFTGHCGDSIRSWCQDGCDVRILILSPSSPGITQLLTVSQNMIHAPRKELGIDLKEKILKSIEDLNVNINVRLSHSHRPRVRYANRDLPFSLNMIDNQMVVTLYGVGAEANKEKTLLITGEESKSFKSFHREFEVLWSDYSNISPFENPLNVYFKSEWQRSINLHSYNRKLPAPRQVVIYPTYKCSTNCSFCMCKKLNQRETEIPVNEFDRVIQELIDFGVKYFEISGGGEPLEHSDFKSLLRIMQRARHENRTIHFGLLTNGRFINQFEKSDLLNTFNEYIRISRWDNVSLASNREELSNWYGTFLSLIKARSRINGSQCKIGAKYLLSEENKEVFADQFNEDLLHGPINQLDYVRFGSDRRMDDDDIAKSEHRIFNILIDNMHLNLTTKVSLGIKKIHFPRNFRCWLSPLSVILDPELDLFICHNFVDDEPNKWIGNLSTGKAFKNIWHGDPHLQLRKKLNRANCDRASFCNCRFAEIQDIYERIYLSLGEHLGV